MNDLIAEFTIPGNPIPKGRPRHGNGTTFTPKRTRDAEKAVRAAFLEACPGWLPTSDNIAFEADFYRATFHACDTDNLLKLVTDALEKVVYRNDRQISDIRGRRIYGARDDARTVVRVYLLDGGI